MTATRRNLLAKTGLAAAGVAVGSGAITGFPTIWAQNIKNITLKQFGTGVSNLNAVAEKVKADLGFTLQMTALDTDAVAQKAVTQPRSYDVADIEYFTVKKVFPTGVLQPMDVKKIKLYDKIVPIFTTGKLTPTSTIAQGTAPITVGFVDGPENPPSSRPAADRLDDADPDHLQRRHAGHPPRSGRPSDHELEGPGRSCLQGQGIDPERAGHRHHGCRDGHGIARQHQIRRQGQHGRSPRIDKTIAFLIETKRSGQFRAFWKSFDESVNLMASGEVIIQSMWSPAVTAVKAKGIACTYQPLKEGYRSWGNGLGLAAHLKGIELDAAYEYINWYLSGWVGAYLNRQGYYSAVLETAKENMTANEWGYWMEGKAATADITSPDGKVIDKVGGVRDGGSFMDRMSKVACWNSVMSEDRYMVQKWNEFIAA